MNWVFFFEQSVLRRRLELVGLLVDIAKKAQGEELRQAVDWIMAEYDDVRDEVFFDNVRMAVACRNEHIEKLVAVTSVCKPEDGPIDGNS